MSTDAWVALFLLGLSGIAHILSYLTLRKKQIEIKKLEDELAAYKFQEVANAVKNGKKRKK